MGIKVLITGAGGFIGKALAKKVIARDDVDKVTLINRNVQGLYESDFSDRVAEVRVDIRYPEVVQDLMEKAKPDLIYHLAGISKVKDTENLVQTNIVGTHHLINSAPDGCKFIFASSLTIHPNYSFPVNEISVCQPESLYGVTKLTGEHILRVAHQQGKLIGRVLRLAAITGLGSTHGVVHDFINKLKGDCEYLEILGDEPGSIKPYVHLDDCVSAFLLAGFDYTPNEFLIANVSQSDVISIKDLAEVVMDNYEIRKEPKWLGSQANWFGDNPLMKACNIKLKLMGWVMKYPSCKEAISAAVIENKMNQVI